MARVYSAKLFEATTAVGGGTATTTVPAGRVWVVRTIVAICNQLVDFEPSGVAEVYDGGGYRLWHVAPPISWSSCAYEADLRSVLDPGDSIIVGATPYAWRFTISGYDLELP